MITFYLSKEYSKQTFLGGLGRFVMAKEDGKKFSEEIVSNYKVS